MDADKKFKLLGLNTPQQLDMVLYDLIKSKDEENLFRLMTEQCYPVSAFVLNLLLDFNYEHLILKAIKESKYINLNIYEWLCIYLGTDEAEKLICETFKESTILSKVSVDGLVKNQRWDTLVKLEKYTVLQKHGKYDLIYDLVKNHGLDFKYMLGGTDYLLKQKDMHLIFHLLCAGFSYSGVYEAFAKLYRENPNLDEDSINFASFGCLNVPDVFLLRLLKDEFYELINTLGAFKFLAREGKAQYIDFDKMYSKCTNLEIADVFFIMAEHNQWDLLWKHREKIYALSKSRCERLNDVYDKLWRKNKFNAH